MRRVYFLKYNNYLNRRVKKEASLNNYLIYSLSIRLNSKTETSHNNDGSTTVYVETNQASSQNYVEANFEYRDGVNTELIVNLPTYEVNKTGTTAQNVLNANSIDYVIVTDLNGNIESRWFIVGNTIISGARHKLTLRRDVIVDNMDVIKAADTQIERAMLDNTDTLIYQSEGHNFNQIKEEELLIKQDNTDLEWYVAYVSRDRGKTTNEQGEIEDYKQIELEVSQPEPDVITIPNIASFPFSTTTTSTGYQAIVKRELKHYITLIGQTNGSPYTHYYMPVDPKNHQEGIYWAEALYNAYPGYREVVDTSSAYRWRFKRAPVANPENYTTYILTHDFKQTEDYLPTLKSNNNYYDETWTKLFDYRDKLIYVQNTQKYYKISWKSEVILDNSLNSSLSTYLSTYRYAANSEYSWLNGLYNSGIIFYNAPGETATNFNESYKLQLKTKRYTVSLVEVNAATSRHKTNGIIYPAYRPDFATTKECNKYGKNVCLDSQYDILLIPYGNFNVIAQEQDTDLNYSGNSNPLTIDTFVSNLKQCLGSYLYDIQKFPYCPVDCLPNLSGIYNYQCSNSGSSFSKRGYRYSYHDYSTIFDIDLSTNTRKISGLVFYIPSSKFRYTQVLSDPYNYSSLSNTDFKIEQETSFFRLCSPSFGAMYEFKGTENNGLHSFDINCTYKPYQPFIQINPDWDGLYGDDFDDSRGLVCDNNFSMTQMTDAWTEYQLQNANFQKIFDRQIESQQYASDTQYALDMISGITGASSGVSSGAITGMMYGGPAGAAVGAVAGGALSLAGGIADAGISQAIREEQISASKDIHKLQLGSVQARPNTLTKLDAFDVNNKKWCVLEYWTASAREKSLLKDYIKYQSMKVGAIGRIADYLEANESFIQGKILRLGTGSYPINCNAETLRAINDELQLGVYWSL